MKLSKTETFAGLEAVALKHYWRRDEEHPINNEWAVFFHKMPGSSEKQYLYIRLEPIAYGEYHSGNWGIQLLPIPPHKDSVHVVGWTAKKLDTLAGSCTKEKRYYVYVEEDVQGIC